jgi:ParB-like chromosome segregation protein Spo0J
VSRWQLLPPLTADEAETLAADIREHGVTDAVELDEAGDIIDGHHRAAIADSLGIDYPTVVRSGWTEQQIVEHVFRKHLGRRNLTTEQRHDVVREMRSRLRWSNVRIAAALGVSDETVRRDLAATSPNVEVDRTVGLDGRERPAHRAPAPDAHLDMQAADDRVRWARLVLGSARFANEGDPAYWAPRLSVEDRAHLAGHIGVVRRFLDEWEAALAAGPRLQMVGGTR